MNDLSNLVESYLWGTFPIDIVWNQLVILCTLLFDMTLDLQTLVQCGQRHTKIGIKYYDVI
jgi:hypothetical protein